MFVQRGFVHLHVHSCYSFLDGASELEPLVLRAASLGMPALALTDHDALHGAVKFVKLCAAYAIQPILGSEVTLDDGTHLTLLARDRAGYANLCRLLTESHGRERLSPGLAWSSLQQYSQGLFCLTGCRKARVPQLVRAHRCTEALTVTQQLIDWFGRENVLVELQDDWTPQSRRCTRELAQLAEELGLRAVATNNVHYALPDGNPIHDILTCVRKGITINTLHTDRPLNDQRYLKSRQEMETLFSWCPEALQNTLWVAERCARVLPENEEITPYYAVEGGARNYLVGLTVRGAAERYGTVTPKIRQRVEHELTVICDLGFADYVLMVHDIVAWARSHGIRAVGRGSAADSCVAYCLHLTDVDVIGRDLPFARFLTAGKTPDIDVDFPSSRRDEVIQHVVDSYGRENVANACTFHTYWGRGAVRDIGKVLELPGPALEFLAEYLSGFVAADRIEEAFGRFAELKQHQHLLPRFKRLSHLCRQIAGFPRHLGTHSSGMVISRVPLATIAPVQLSARGITRIWTLDKDDAEEVGAIKFDVLALRMLSAIEDAEADILRTNHLFCYDRIPIDDKSTYHMIQSGGAVGTFQFESSAQLSLAVSLVPSGFEDLVAAVALIRPGPVKGRVVQRFVEARHGHRRVDVLHPCLADVLGKTFGCVIFQEQVTQVVSRITGCSETEADRWRKGLKRHAQQGTLLEAKELFLERAHRYTHDLSPAASEEIWTQVASWGGYGFLEGHAAAFALTGYRTAYMSVHHAAEFFSGILNNQPMGFYSNNSIASEARRRGVRILPVDINLSEDNSLADDDGAIRLGLRLVAGLRKEDILGIVEARRRGTFTGLVDFCARVLLHRDHLENLILTGCFDLLHESRRRGLLFSLEQTLGIARSYRAERVGAQQQLLFEGLSRVPTPIAAVAEMSEWQQLLWTWRISGVTPNCHVFAHLRDRLAKRGVVSVYRALQQEDGAKVRVAGLNIRPHRPPTVSGKPVLFNSVEDESGLLQTVCFGKVIEEYTAVFLTAPAVIVEGIIERKGNGAGMRVLRAAPLRLADVEPRDRESIPPRREERAAGSDLSPLSSSNAQTIPHKIIQPGR